MIHMCMGDEDMGDRFTRECLFQCFDMRRIAWSRIDNSDIPLTDNVGTGTPERKRGWVFGQNTTDQRTDLPTDLIFKVELVDELYICHTDYSISP